MLNKKTINLTVSSPKTPFELTISTCDGFFIARKTILSNSARFCLLTNACCLRLSARYQNQTIVKNYFISSCRCQNVFANFVFTLIPPPSPTPTPQYFTLIDKNYGLPVQNAILNFTN